MTATTINWLNFQNYQTSEKVVPFFNRQCKGQTLSTCSNTNSGASRTLSSLKLPDFLEVPGMHGWYIQRMGTGNYT